MSTKCRHCGSTSYGHGCVYGPGRIHEHRDDDDKGNPGDPIKFANFFKEHSADVDETVVRNLFEGLGVEEVTDGNADEGVKA